MKTLSKLAALLVQYWMQPLSWKHKKHYIFKRNSENTVVILRRRLIFPYHGDESYKDLLLNCFEFAISF
jgi:hypothetical protein